MNINSLLYKNYLLNNSIFLSGEETQDKTKATSNSIFEKSQDYSKIKDSIFENIDTDRNGKINDEEIVSFNEQKGTNKSKIKSDLTSIYNTLDSDGDGLLTKNELSELDNKSVDGLSSKLVQKLMAAFGMNVEGKDEIQADLDALQEQMNLQNQEEINSTSSSSNTSSPATSSPTSNFNGGLDNIEKSPKAKTEEEYKQEIKQKEAEKKNIQEESAQGIADEEQNIQDAMESAESGLTPQQINEYNVERDRINSEIKVQDDIINSQTTIMQEKQAQYDAIPATISAYDDQISNLRASISSGDSEEDKEKNERIKQKISNLEQEKAKKIEEQKQLKTDIEQIQTDIETAKADKTKLETESDELLDKFLEENKNVIPMEIQQQIRQSQQNILSLRQERDSKINTVDSELTKLQTGLAELKEKEESDSVIDKNKESSFDKDGNRIGTRKMPKTAEEYAKYGLDTPEEIARFEACHQQSKEHLIDMLDYAIENGLKVNIASSLRTYEEQCRIYKGGKNPMAARPGTSMHESGQAFDIAIEGANRSNPNDPAFKLLGEFWMKRGFRWGATFKNQCEPWHFDTKGSF